MVDRLHIKFGQAGASGHLTSQAEEVFANMGSRNPSLFLYDEFTQNPNILGVGFLEQSAVVAMAVAEKAESSLAGVDYSPETWRFLDVPYLAIEGLVTVAQFRQRGYATEMIKAALKLARFADFHRVSASDVVRPTERFWLNRGFVQPPRLPFTNDLARETCVPVDALAAKAEVELAVLERLNDFSSRSLSVSGLRQQ